MGVARIRSVRKATAVRSLGCDAARTIEGERLRRLPRANGGDSRVARVQSGRRRTSPPWELIRREACINETLIGGVDVRFKT